MGKRCLADNKIAFRQKKKYPTFEHETKSGYPQVAPCLEHV
jgi:hypothetical protein